MQDIYEELLGHMHDSPVIGRYLTKDIPDWQNLLNDETMSMLSSGESVLVYIALALYNGDTTARFADVLRVDSENQRRILDALSLRLSQF